MNVENDDIFIFHILSLETSQQSFANLCKNNQ